MERNGIVMRAMKMLHDLDRLLDASLDGFFKKPFHLEQQSAWIGHVPFLQWLLSSISPKVFVELGTHTGVSYFAACERIIEENMACKCFAIDTWEGDAHLGRYGEAAYETVSAINAEKFAAFSYLLRMTFDAALSKFDSGSIDLLHIDGTHTYEAVRHDFETWLPKLSPSAVVLFHDIHAQLPGFGVHQLWAELKTQYRTFEFEHCYGLGVLLIGNEIPAGLDPLFCSGEARHRTIAERFAFLGERWRHEVKRTAEREHLEGKIEKLNAEALSQKAEISDLKQKLKKEISDLQKKLKKQEAQAADKLELQAKTQNRKIAVLRQGYNRRREFLDLLFRQMGNGVREANPESQLPNMILPLWILGNADEFDIDWYEQNYPETSSRHPIVHYFEEGAKKLYNPSQRFNTKYYVETYREVGQLGMNPLVHFILFGRQRGFSPVPKVPNAPEAAPVPIS